MARAEVEVRRKRGHHSILQTVSTFYRCWIRRHHDGMAERMDHSPSLDRQGPGDAA